MAESLLLPEKMQDEGQREIRKERGGRERGVLPRVGHRFGAFNFFLLKVKFPLCASSVGAKCLFALIQNWVFTQGDKFQVALHQLSYMVLPIWSYGTSSVLLCILHDFSENQVACFKSSFLDFGVIVVSYALLI